MHKAALIALCTLWVTLSGTHAQMCGVTLDFTTDIAINTSITTCVQCVIGGNVQTIVQWRAGGELLTNGQDGVEIVNGVLVINDANMFFAALQPPFELLCSTPSGDNSDRVYRAGFFAPSVTVSNAGSSVIDEGGSITLICDQTNIPGSTIRVWLDPEGMPIPDSFQSLILTNLQRSEAGDYQCQLTSVMDGSIQSDSITVTVNYPTSVTSNSPATQQIGLGSSLTLACTYDSVPPSTVTWRHNGTLLTSGTSSNGVTSTLTVNNLMRDSGGEYECMAMNTLASGNTTTDTSTFMVTIQIPPDPATNLVVSNIQETSVDLSWNNGFNGLSPITGVEVQVIAGVNMSTVQVMFDGDASLESTTVSSLSVFTDYEFRLFVRNVIGLSTPVSVFAMTLSLSLPAPTIISLTSPTSTSLLVDWEPPVFNNRTTDDPNSWIIELLNSDTTVINTTTIQEPDTTEFLFISLEKGTTYSVRVAGTNDRGMGAFSATVTNQTLVDPPSMPQNLIGASVSAFGLELSWDGPAEDGGSPVTQYVVSYREMGGSQFREVPRGVDETELLLRNGGNPTPPLSLMNSTTYEIRVQAENVAGRGDEATITITTQSIEQPQRIFDPVTPSDVTNLTAVISWEFPGGMVTNFIVQYKLRAGDWANPGDVTNITVPGNMTSVTFRDLRPDAQYDVRVLTMNALGSSEFSLEATFTTASPSPPIVAGPTSAPTGQRAQINCSSTIDSLSLIWFRVSSSGGDLVPLPPTARQVGDDLVFLEPTLMDTGIYACQLGSVSTNHTIRFIGPPSGPEGISMSVIIIVCVVGGVALLVFVCVIVLACYCTCCSKSSSNTSSYNVKSKTKTPGKGKRSMTWIETSTKFVPNTNPNYARKPDEPSPFDMPDDLTTHSSFNTLEKQNRIHQGENPPPSYNNSNV